MSDGFQRPGDRLFCALFVHYQSAAEAYTEAYPDLWQIALDNTADADGIPRPDLARRRIRHQANDLLRKKDFKDEIQRLYQEAHDVEGVTTHEIVAKHRRAYEHAQDLGDSKAMVQATSALATVAGLIPDRYNRILAPHLSVSFASEAGDPNNLTVPELVWFRYLQAKYQGLPQPELERFAPDIPLLSPSAPNAPTMIEATVSSVIEAAE